VENACRRNERTYPHASAACTSCSNYVKCIGTNSVKYLGYDPIYMYIGAHLMCRRVGRMTAGPHAEPGGQPERADHLRRLQSVCTPYSNSFSAGFHPTSYLGASQRDGASSSPPYLALALPAGATRRAERRADIWETTPSRWGDYHPPLNSL
jgi:hypothetical protein